MVVYYKHLNFKKRAILMEYLKKLVNEDIIVKIKRKYYEQKNDELISDATIRTKLFTDAVVYLDSALFIYGYVYRTPNE